MSKLTRYFEGFLKFGMQLIQTDSDNYVRLKHENNLLCGAFWALCCIKFCKGKIDYNVAPILDLIDKCEYVIDIDGKSMLGFRQFKTPVWYIANVSSTLYSCQLAHVLERDLINVEKTLVFLQQLQQPSGGFAYSLYDLNNSDIRHSMSAIVAIVVCLRLRGAVNIENKIESIVNCNTLVEYVKRHFNLDGGIALRPGLESHAGAAFCAIGILVMLNRLGEIPRHQQDMLQCWLLTRLSQTGGARGRVGKRLDLCYSWWNLATLSLIGAKLPRKHLKKMQAFIWDCQAENGGLRSTQDPEIAESVESDPYHSFTGLATIILIHQEFLLEPLVPLKLLVPLALAESNIIEM
ncbi:bifunctional Prenyltransferase subunit beta/Terpenoid cyclases-protein prenyltransferase alpha-alpha toroid/PFTB repeat [Babesia duncani]|uniref:Geranylgeranyl transferase type II subunit beta n=1 Tax=Babesia duncani TaxID=323732 RepID=A0AAD9UPK0_9APIC|nr:bifunctional Prenyltransferase subunit beta/Terpenoid cyclases-protein prenyltransferase alpha-alpha toroid/PFTB repeat [Babesia duncani]